MLPLVDDFKVEPVFADRTYERHQFKLVIDGRNYKGDFHEGEIHWLNPHPKQYVGKSEMKALEAEIRDLLTERGVEDETDKLEVEPMLINPESQLHLFKLKIQGQEFKGIFRDGEIEWFHPEPRYKMRDERVEKVEEKVHEKMQKLMK